MTDIGPGDFIECIDDLRSINPQSMLVLGAIYTAVEVFDDDRGTPGVSVKEATPPAPYYGFAISLFRPVYRPKASLIESLSTPATEDA